MTVALLVGGAVLAGLSVLARPSALASRLARLRPPSRSSSSWPRLGRLVGLAAAGLMGAMGGGAWMGPAGALAGGIGGAVAVRQLGDLARRRRLQRLAAQVPEAVELIAASVRAGQSVRQALPVGAAVGPPLEPVLDRAGAALEMGCPMEDVLDDLARSEPVLAPLAAALHIGVVAGGDLARALDRLAGAGRERLRLQREVGALTAQVRFSGAVLGALPLCALILFSLNGSAAQRAFFREPLGQLFLIAGLALDALGYALLRRLGRPGAP